MNSCSHENSLDDYTTGDMVCAECGLVLGRLLGGGKMTHASAHPPVYKNLSSYGEYMRIREGFMHVCSSLNVDCGLVIDNAVDMFFKLTAKSGKTPVMNKAPCEMAYAIWETLSRQKTPKSPLLICRICDVDPTSLLKLEKTLNLVPSYCAPSLYVEYACDCLEIPYGIAQLAKKLLEHVENEYFGHMPEALAAASILNVKKRVWEEENKSTNMMCPTRKTVLDHFPVTKKCMLAASKVLPDYSLKWVEKGRWHLRPKYLLVFKDSAENNLASNPKSEQV